jgi:hypothetical protein
MTFYLDTDELLIAIEAVEGALMRLIRPRPDIAESVTVGS